MPHDKDGLTPLARRFTEALLGEAKGNATDAARMAGSKAKDLAAAGSEFLRNPNVARVVAAGKKRAAKAADVTQDTIVQGLLGETETTGERGQAGARVKAWAEIGKLLGLVTLKHELTGKDGGPIDHTHGVKGLTTEQLVEALGAKSDDSSDAS